MSTLFWGLIVDQIYAKVMLYIYEVVIMGKTTYNAELAEEVCRVLASSSKSLNKLCKLHKHWPPRSTLFEWRMRNDDFAASYARARQHQIEAFIDDIVDIADDASNDYMEDEDGNLVDRPDHIARSRLRVDTRKWLACKLVPKLYGDRTPKTDDDTQDAISKVRID